MIRADRTATEAWEVFRDAEELHDASENSFCEALWRQISALLSLLAPSMPGEIKTKFMSL